MNDLTGSSKERVPPKRPEIKSADNAEWVDYYDPAEADAYMEWQTVEIVRLQQRVKWLEEARDECINCAKRASHEPRALPIPGGTPFATVVLKDGLVIGAAVHDTSIREGSFDLFSNPTPQPRAALGDGEIAAFLGELDGYSDRHEIVRKWASMLGQPPAAAPKLLFRAPAAPKPEPCAMLEYGEHRFLLPYTLIHWISGWIAIGAAGSSIDRSIVGNTLSAFHNLAAQMGFDASPLTESEKRFYDGHGISTGPHFSCVTDCSEGTTATKHPEQVKP